MFSFPNPKRVGEFFWFMAETDTGKSIGVYSTDRATTLTHFSHFCIFRISIFLHSHTPHPKAKREWNYPLPTIHFSDVYSTAHTNANSAANAIPIHTTSIIPLPLIHNQIQPRDHQWYHSVRPLIHLPHFDSTKNLFLLHQSQVRPALAASSPLPPQLDNRDYI